MTPKYYNQRIEKKRLEAYKSAFSHFNLIRRSRKEPSDSAGSIFNNAGLTEVHVLTIQSPSMDKINDFLDISFKEWEEWLNDCELKQAQRQYKYREPYTPIEWQKP